MSEPVVHGLEVIDIEQDCAQWPTPVPCHQQHCIQPGERTPAVRQAGQLIGVRHLLRLRSQPHGMVARMVQRLLAPHLLRHVHRHTENGDAVAKAVELVAHGHSQHRLQLLAGADAVDEAESFARGPVQGDLAEQFLSPVRQFAAYVAGIGRERARQAVHFQHLGRPVLRARHEVQPPAPNTGSILRQVEQRQAAAHLDVAGHQFILQFLPVQQHGGNRQHRAQHGENPALQHQGRHVRLHVEEGHGRVVGNAKRARHDNVQQDKDLAGHLAKTHCRHHDGRKQQGHQHGARDLQGGQRQQTAGCQQGMKGRIEQPAIERPAPLSLPVAEQQQQRCEQDDAEHIGKEPPGELRQALFGAKGYGDDCPCKASHHRRSEQPCHLPELPRFLAPPAQRSDGQLGGDAGLHDACDGIGNGRLSGKAHQPDRGSLHDQQDRAQHRPARTRHGQEGSHCRARWRPDQHDAAQAVAHGYAAYRQHSPQQAHTCWLAKVSPDAQWHVLPRHCRGDSCNS